jgi:cytochrome P450
MLLPIFSPQRIAELEPSTKAYCQELIDDMAGRTRVDAAAEYAQHIPVRVIANMLGLPEEDADRFRGFVNHVLEGVALPMEKRAEGMLALFGYLQEHIEDHIANPRDDLISLLLDSEMAGQKLDPFQVGRTIALLLIAGIDTTWSALGASLWHLARTPADRERLVAEPELLPVAMEELLRAYAPVTMARLVREDMEWNGCPMKAEEFVLLPFPSANRDPEAFDRPNEVLIDREQNRHAAFGLGIHRCAGSHLARMELRVALEVWLANFPSFELADPDAVRWSGGQVRGPRVLPIDVKR